MNSQWMTTLLSKGIELEQGLRRQFESAQSQLKRELEDRGIRLSAADFAALIEEVAPRSSRQALSYALDLLRPFSAGMGFRISKLSDEKIELVIPNRPRNRNEAGDLHEGALITGGLEAAKLMWSRHAPVGHFEILIKTLQFQNLRSSKQDLRCRLELSETSREAALSQLRSRREADCELQVSFFEEGDQAVADLQLLLKLKLTPTLNPPEE